MFKKVLFTSIALTTCATQVFAHGVWAGMRADKMQIVYGEGPLDNFYNPEWFASAKGYNADMQDATVTVDQDGDKIYLQPDATVEIISIVSENGYWSNTNSGKWVNQAKDENPEATKGKQHHKMSVNYISQDIVLKGEKPNKIAKPQALGLEMEIVPSLDPRFLQAGDELTVQVLFQGEPMKNIAIMPDSINRLGETITTDEQGQATVTVANNGVNMIAIETAFDRDDKTKADSDAYFSSLNFTIMPSE